ncbi:hypothetical protein B0H19DRAFT_376921 [Mycena capillaripes]|nr:hypothetical protein B0H19DRAFT_376921 [Mycena capillaripes]
MVRTHQALPFHNVREWNNAGQYYMRAQLCDMGLRIPLGHAGATCPTPYAGRLEAITTKGIIDVTVDFCSCANAATASEQINAHGWSEMRSNFVLAIPLDVIWTLLVPESEAESESEPESHAEDGDISRSETSVEPDSSSETE